MISTSCLTIIILSLIHSRTVTFLVANDRVAHSALGRPRLTQYVATKDLSLVATASEQYSANDKTFYSANTRSRKDILTSHRRLRDQLLANERYLFISHDHLLTNKRLLNTSRDHMLANERRQLNTSELSAGKSSRRQSIRRRARRGAIVRFEVETYQMWALPINYVINSSFSGNNTLYCKRA
jgi:hypothetical protein